MGFNSAFKGLMTLQQMHRLYTVQW